jgi:hypothetical protein
MTSGGTGIIIMMTRTRTTPRETTTPIRRRAGIKFDTGIKLYLYGEFEAA